MESLSGVKIGDKIGTSKARRAEVGVEALGEGNERMSHKLGGQKAL